VSYSEWANFWKDQKQSFHAVMRVSTTFFAERIEKLSLIKRSDTLLDYGCGPGFLADYFSNKGVSITGADINTSFIEQGKKNHPDSSFVLITTNSTENEKILKDTITDKRFNVIILLSIAQYYENENELEKTIRLLLPYLRESGKIIIADIINEKTSSLQDALSIFILCVRKRKVISFIKFIFYLLFSNYSDVSKKAKLLTVSEQSIRQIAAGLFLDYEKVDGLTPHPTRTNYILKKVLK